MRIRYTELLDIFTQQPQVKMARYWNTTAVLLQILGILVLAWPVPTDCLSLEDRWQQLTENYVGIRIKLTFFFV